MSSPARKNSPKNRASRRRKKAERNVREAQQPRIAKNQDAKAGTFSTSSAAERDNQTPPKTRVNPDAPFYRVSSFSLTGTPVQSHDVTTVKEAATLMAGHAKRGHLASVAVMPARHPDEDRLHQELMLGLVEAGVMDAPKGYSPGNHDVVIASAKK